MTPQVDLTPQIDLRHGERYLPYWPLTGAERFPQICDAWQPPSVRMPITRSHSKVTADRPEAFRQNCRNRRSRTVTVVHRTVTGSFPPIGGSRGPRTVTWYERSVIAGSGRSAITLLSLSVVEVDIR